VPAAREGHKPEHPTWDGPTLVVRGTKSPYITDENLPSFKAFFPNARVEGLDAGHWGKSFFLILLFFMGSADGENSTRGEAERVSRVGG
jgi:hypothetical protein